MTQNSFQFVRPIVESLHPYGADVLERVKHFQVMFKTLFHMPMVGGLSLSFKKKLDEKGGANTAQKVYNQLLSRWAKSKTGDKAEAYFRNVDTAVTALARITEFDTSSQGKIDEILAAFDVDCTISLETFKIGAIPMTSSTLVEDLRNFRYIKGCTTKDGAIAFPTPLKDAYNTLLAHMDAAIARFLASFANRTIDTQAAIMFYAPGVSAADKVQVERICARLFAAQKTRITTVMSQRSFSLDDDSDRKDQDRRLDSSQIALEAAEKSFGDLFRRIFAYDTDPSMSTSTSTNTTNSIMSGGGNVINFFKSLSDAAFRYTAFLTFRYIGFLIGATLDSVFGSHLKISTLLAGVHLKHGGAGRNVLDLLWYFLSQQTLLPTNEIKVVFSSDDTSAVSNYADDVTFYLDDTPDLSILDFPAETQDATNHIILLMTSTLWDEKVVRAFRSFAATSTHSQTSITTEANRLVGTLISVQRDSAPIDAESRAKDNYDALKGINPENEIARYILTKLLHDATSPTASVRYMLLRLLLTTARVDRSFVTVLEKLDVKSGAREQLSAVERHARTLASSKCKFAYSYSADPMTSDCNQLKKLLAELDEHPATLMRDGGSSRVRKSSRIKSHPSCIDRVTLNASLAAGRTRVRVVKVTQAGVRCVCINGVSKPLHELRGKYKRLIE